MKKKKKSKLNRTKNTPQTPQKTPKTPTKHQSNIKLNLESNLIYQIKSNLKTYPLTNKQKI